MAVHIAAGGVGDVDDEMLHGKENPIRFSRTYFFSIFFCVLCARKRTRAHSLVKVPFL